MRYLQLLATGIALATSALACSDDDDLLPPPTLVTGAAGVGIPFIPGDKIVCAALPFVPRSRKHSTAFEAPAVASDPPPPPISGGTLMVSQDGKKLVAADPDRDAVYVVDLASRTLEHAIGLRPHDEPGRVVEDGAGRIHVALRGGRGIVTFALNGVGAPRVSELCDLPRGIAYDAARDRLYVACADGALLRVVPATGKPDARTELGRDLRDVVVRDGFVFVTRFRSAELIRIEPEAGTVIHTIRARDTNRTELHAGGDGKAACTFQMQSTIQAVTAEPEVAWRAIGLPQQGVLMLHQRAKREVTPSGSGAYGPASDCGRGLVHGAITVMDGVMSTSTDLVMAGLFVDVAVSPSARLLALADPAGWGTDASVYVVELASILGRGTPNLDTGPDCAAERLSFAPSGQVTSVAWLSDTLLVAQTREPAGVAFMDLESGAPIVELDFRQKPRADTGHAMFHALTNSGVACASCHPEAGDDGRVWRFERSGARRTPSLRGGLLATAPFQWNGDLPDFGAVVRDVLVSSMEEQDPGADRANALASWLDGQPALRARAADEAAAERGKALFESSEVGCASCHAGERFTNNANAFVGTGAVLQVPSLRGVAFHEPLMHDGCARALSDRFGPCGGGEQHGHTAQLDSGQLADLTAYLQTL